MTRLRKLTLALPALLIAAGCSQREASEAANSMEAPLTPDVSVTAPPGVAFSYAYSFGLEAPKIARLQERHAAACEALGIGKCRITGLRFHRSGDKEISGSLELALAPEIARKFGRDATSVVEAEKGVVSSIQIEGVDRAADMADSDRDIASAQAERKALEQDAANTALSAGARRQLLDQLGEQRRAEREATARGTAAQRSLATTPMRFAYSTEGFLPGIGLDRTAWSALGVAGMILNALFALLVVLGALAVPAGLVLLALAHGRKHATRLWRWLAPKEPAPDAG